MATSQVLAVAGEPASPSSPSTDPATAAPAAVPSPDTAGEQYSLLVTRDDEHVRAAQRLRYAVFAGEQGAHLAGPGADAGLDADDFDAYCDHLVVREDATGEIVGTYRMLTPQGAEAAGRLYSDTEFDLAALAGLRPRTVEVGRSCVHPGHRNGAVLSLVWAGIGRYLLLTGHRWVVGCASVPLTAGGELPGAVWSQVAGRHLAPAARRVVPHHPAPVGPWDAEAPGAARAARAAVPPLLGYLRLGAEIGGRPALDLDFGVADLFVLLDHEAVDPRWRRHLLGEGG